MKSKKEIREQKQDDRAFIVSAITMELQQLAYIEYFNQWEGNGGMGWFFNMCVELADEIMFTEGSAYLKWLDVWIANEDKYCEGFSEVTGETCYDWYHMNEARRIFESRYEKDSPSEIKEQVSEHIGLYLNDFKTHEGRLEVITMASDFAKKKREDNKLKQIIQDLREINADSKTISTIKLSLNIK